MNDKLIEINDLSVQFYTPECQVRAIDRVTFDIAVGETLGLVGESGCGKSVTSLSILNLIPSPPGRITSGQILFENRDLLAEDPENLRRIRGRDIAMIFQEPMTSLNPVLSIGHQVAEPLMIHEGLSKSAAYKEATSWLERVKIPAAKRRFSDYPHQFSIGMQQRVMIAMAMVCRPKLLIADEPTTALDVTIQAQILSLMVDLKKELGMSVLLITHDLGVIAQMASRVLVMYAGELIEEAGVFDLFDRPFHPYTRGLLKSIPQLESRRSGQAARLNEIKGTVPRLTEGIKGCKFADRCPHVFNLCREERPQPLFIRDGQWARCWLKDYPKQRKADA
jgi:oligopeptide/dipeptide ABC transporter ATP-binding protein